MDDQTQKRSSSSGPLVKMNRWLSALLATLPCSREETPGTLKAKVAAYSMFLSEYADLADDRAMREALGRHQFFPSPLQLKEMFEERRRSNVTRIYSDPEFKPSYDLQEPFQELKDVIGVLAYKAWFRGAEAWRRTDGGVTIRAANSFKARWIRENYAPALESALGANVEVTC